MSGKRPPGHPPEDAWVSLIEELLDSASTRHSAGDWRGRAWHVLTICACITLDVSPDWIIFDTEDGIGWRRWPDDISDKDFVRAPLAAGGHADPAEVAAWLQGGAEDPWAGGDGYGDPEVVIALRRWIAAP